MATEQTDVLKKAKTGMRKAIEALKSEFSGLRTGRASAGLLDSVRVEAYGAKTPLSQIGTVSVPEPRLLSVQIWDKALVSAAERALREANLGIEPVVDGQIIRLPTPRLTEERRTEIARMAGKFAETARVSVRLARRDALDVLKKQKNLGEDEKERTSSEIQRLTDAHIGDIDELLTKKQEDIMQV